MLKIIKYLNGHLSEDPLGALKSLEDEFGIKASHDPRYPELYVLNYSQINSPKTTPIVRECRSLVVEFVKPGEWKIVSRAFDRFFNAGEKGVTQDLEFDELTAFEKMDGSLISLFHHPAYGWLYRTKSMIMPENQKLDTEVLWKDLIEESFGKLFMDNYVPYYISRDPDSTFILELTSPANRLVTRYPEIGITLLAIRNNKTGRYVNQDSTGMIAEALGWNRPRTWKFSTLEECVQASKDLPNLEEGYVMYDLNGVPVAKVKNPAYVAAHYLRGECAPTKRRVLKMMEDNEVDEYLSSFPEDSGMLMPMINAYADLLKDARDSWEALKDIEDRKEFSEEVRKRKCWPLLFSMRDGIEPEESFRRMLVNGKLKLLNNYMEKDYG